MTPKLDILLVEDDQADAHLVRNLLSTVPGASHGLTRAGRLLEAIQILKERPYDIIFLDLHLPDSQGFSTFLKMKQQASDIPIVVLTALDDESVALKVVEKGGQDYLLKQKVDGKDLARAMRLAAQWQMLTGKLRALSLTDELTGLHNRKGFMFLSQQALNVAGRSKDETLFFLFADIDQMKWINHHHGHAEGNRALVDFTRILKETFRASDIIARVGGDEFAVMAVDHVAEGPSITAKRLRENIQMHNETADRPYELGVSAGSIRYDPRHPVPINDLLQRADQLISLGKNSQKHVRWT